MEEEDGYAGPFAPIHVRASGGPPTYCQGTCCTAACSRVRGGRLANRWPFWRQQRLQQEQHRRQKRQGEQRGCRWLMMLPQLLPWRAGGRA